MTDTTVIPKPASRIERAAQYLTVAGLLALLIVIGVLGLAYGMMITGKTETDSFKILLGSLMAGFTGIAGFYFGNSIAQKSRDDTQVATVTALTAAVTANAGQPPAAPNGAPKP